MAEGRRLIFREKTLDRISSPEQLTDYLRVTNPNIWILLASVVLLLAGLLVWSSVGTLETETTVKVVVQSHKAQVVSTEPEALAAGMPLRVLGRETLIAYTQPDEFERPVGTAEIDLPDGTYDGIVITEGVRPIKFLFEKW